MSLLDPIVGIHPELREIRRDIHAHPELGFEEVRTSQIVKEKLTDWGIPVISGMGGTGIVGVIKSGGSSRAIGLRADMDALPIQEANTFSHASVHTGKMHACGHDGHVAMLLGAAHYLAHNRNFDGTVYLIFQPAEEGQGGAKKMIEDGLFEKHPMDAVYGMHNAPTAPLGKFIVRPGAMMASSNRFELNVKGRGGHAAHPEKTVDPIAVAIQIAHAWQTIITRNKDPLQPAVLSLTQIQAGTAANVVPDSASMKGTVRTFSSTVLDLIESRMRLVAEHIAAAFSAEVQFTFIRSYPPLVNHLSHTEIALKVMRSLVGEDNVIVLADPVMGSEDFAFMLQEKPGCYVFIGGGSMPAGGVGGREALCDLHNPHYDFNDDILPLGATYWVRLVEEILVRSVKPELNEIA